MSTEQLNSFSSILSVNPYDNEYVNGVSNFLHQEKNPKYIKEQFVTSYLNTQNYINNQIEISINIPDEDIFDAINIKVYDELGLDQAIEYQIQYIETFTNLDGENRHFQVFLVDPLKLNEIFQEAVETIKYIDCITPSPLLIKSLYSKEIIQDNGIHSFIYFEKDDAFITIYNEKEFIYTKSLKFSLVQMHEKFCELYGEKIEYSEFINFLTQDNLKYTESPYKIFILQLYKELFTTINEILTYAKKAFNIEKVSHIYIGSEIDLASKLYEISEVELGIESSDFNFDYGFETNNEYINQIHALIHITTRLEDDEKYLCNFSTFNRPPKFTKRHSGRFLILVAASFIIAFAYPITYWLLTYAQEIQYELLESEYQVLHAKKSTRQALIKSKVAEKEKSLSLLKDETDSYTAKKNTLTKIHDVKVNYPMKAKLIAQITQDLNKYSVKIQNITYSQIETDKYLTLNLISNKDQKITSLLEYLTKKYDRKFKFLLEEIRYSKEKKNYLSELKVSIL